MRTSRSVVAAEQGQRAGPVNDHRLSRIVHAGARERTTLDLRGLGPAIRAHAKARNMPVSAVARMAVARMLESSGVAAGPTEAEPEVAAGPAVKVTVRVSRRVARDLATRARASGLSHGAYVSLLVDAAPIAIDPKEAVRALAVSTDVLASVAADLNAFARFTQRGTSRSAEQSDDAVITLSRELRAHLRVAARLAADLQPMAAWRRDAGKRVGARTTP